MENGIHRSDVSHEEPRSRTARQAPRVIAKGTCNGNSTAKLKLSPENGRIEVEFDQNRNGVTWNYKLSRAGVKLASGTKVTNAPSSSFTARGLVSNTAGPDMITARATRSNGEVCTARATLEPLPDGDTEFQLLRGGLDLDTLRHNPKSEVLPERDRRTWDGGVRFVVDHPEDEAWSISISSTGSRLRYDNDENPVPKSSIEDPHPRTCKASIVATEALVYDLKVHDRESSGLDRDERWVRDAKFVGVGARYGLA